MGLVMPLLAPDFRVIAPDSIGGFGDTDPYAPAPYGLINRATQLEAFADTMCLNKFTLTGNSQGAWAAVRYACLHPDRVEKLILISSLTIAQGLGIDQPRTPALAALEGYDGTREGMRKLLDALIIDKSRITDALIDRRQKSATRPGAMEAAKEFVKNTGAARKNPALALQFDLRVSLPAIAKQIPTIFMWGDADTFAIPETGKAIEKAVPEIKFHWIAGAGHQVQTDKPEESAEIIRSFAFS